MMMNVLICALVVGLCVSITVNRYYRLQNADLRRELADATDWMDPIQIESVGDDDEL